MGNLHSSKNVFHLFIAVELKNISANKKIADPTIKHYYIVQLVQHFILH